MWRLSLHSLGACISVRRHTATPNAKIGYQQKRHAIPKKEKKRNAPFEPKEHAKYVVLTRGAELEEGRHSKNVSTDYTSSTLVNNNTSR